MPHELDFGRGALAVVRSTAPDLAVVARPAPSIPSKADVQTAGSDRHVIGKVPAQVSFLHCRLQRHDLRTLPFAERGLIPDDELEELVRLDVPGAMTELSLRACLRRHPTISRDAVKPHCAP